MEPIDLPKVWDAPDYSKLTPKQISIRLSIKVAAKIAALNDLYPQKTKTEIINDLLGSALDKLAEGLPGAGGGRVHGTTPDGEVIAEDIGISARFYELTNKYLKEIEKESGMIPTEAISLTSKKQKKGSRR